MPHPALECVVAGHHLSFEEMTSAVNEIMHGNWSADEMRQFLLALHEKGETVDEVAGAAQAMRQNMTRIHSNHPVLLDTCGTGGDGSGTFNISTAAAIVVAAAGVPVAKHGNRNITSKTGSANVLHELGVNIEATVPQAERCLDEVGICFCFAPLMHQSMRHVATVRRELNVPTIFNLLGPLCNPANATHQLLGVGRPQLRPLISNALARLRPQRAVVVSGADGLDEVTLAAATHCTEIQNDELREFTWTPADFGLRQVADLSQMQVESPAESAAMIRSVLANQPGDPREIVVLNAAAALWTASVASTPRACCEIASQTIASGKAADTLRRLAEQSHR